MLRRTVLIVGSLGTAGCGFRLRGAQALPFERLHSGFGRESALGREFERSLQTNGVRLVPQTEAQVLLDVLVDTREKVVLSLNASGQVREFQLRQRLKFRLRSATGRDLIEDTELAVTRDISFNETAALAKEAEELLLFKDMQGDILRQLLRRLASVNLGQ